MLDRSFLFRTLGKEYCTVTANITVRLARLALYQKSNVFFLQLPKKQFRYASEFTTRAELEALALDLDSLRLQSLIICERILGTQHKVGLRLIT